MVGASKLGSISVKKKVVFGTFGGPSPKKKVGSKIGFCFVLSRGTGHVRIQLKVEVLPRAPGNSRYEIDVLNL